VFEHTVQIKFENVPKVCDQAFVFASNDINFLSRNLTGHQVENNIYIDPLRPEHYRFGLVHDYRRNHDSDFKKLCHKSDKDDGEVLQQEGSPGIFMAVEVEKVAMDLRSTKDVQKAVTKALEQEGFQVDSILKRTAASEFSGSPSDEIVLLLREGYVIIRTWAEHNYCAFDIHLWGSFEKHESAKKAVVASVGGKMKTTSSYRIVAGGMFGVSTWKDDAKANGPQPDKLCDPSEAPSRDAPLDPSTVEVALEAGLRLTLDEDPIIAAVVCGDAKACASIDLLKKNDKVGQVIVLMCPELKPKDELYQDGPERVIACEKEILKTFEESLTGEKLLGAIVLDAGASRLMGKILLKILSGSKSRSSTQILAPNMLAIATIDKEETESWRRNFLNEIRVDIVKLDPVFRAEILFNTTDHSMELGVTSAGDEHFVERLVAIVADVEKESGLSVEVREFHGGFWRSAEKAIMKDSDADFVFSHDSYDGAAAMEQWNSQQPLGHQSLFQFETRPLVVGDHVHALLEGDMSEGVVTLANSDNTYKIRFTEDGIFYKVVHRNNIRKLFGSPNDAKVTASQVKTALETALSGMPSTMILDAKVQELPSAGDGSVLAAFWSGGSILFMWDGRIHLDMNIFTFLESTNLPEKLALRLKQEISGLETILRDEQPRGYGRAVNFQKDVGKTERKVPFWA
jgi:S-adenosylmethionine/arginine decarboxylase-like enzyme